MSTLIASIGGDAIDNMINNQIEDAVFGAIGQVGKRASRQLGDWTGTPKGIQAGPADTAAAGYGWQATGNGMSLPQVDIF